MRHAAILLLGVFAFCVGHTTAKSPPPSGMVIPGTLERVKDGDTVVFTTQLTFSVRFLNCYVPDDNKEINTRATADLKQYAEGKPVQLFIPLGSFADMVSFERVLGEVWLYNPNTKKPQTRSLSEWQVARGNATSTPNGELGK